MVRWTSMRSGQGPTRRGGRGANLRYNLDDLPPEYELRSSLDKKDKSQVKWEMKQSP